jgi:carbonic anhydrase/acetyltransferase-like protein (isoleucine patch superfamily)
VAVYALGDREPDIHPDAFVHPQATVIGAVTLGAEATVWPQAVLRADYGTIRIGARTSVQDGSVLHCTAEYPTIVGADCVIGHLVHLEGCTIEDGCLVGSNSVVLHGVVVRSGALVAASALVPEGMEVPTGAIAMGVPARLRPDAVRPEMIGRGVENYRANGRRYRAELRRLDG